ncbi:hypothetical protein BLA24_13960 [Streptomyces cinnamoneus]|uniref:DUF2267 domain-containing protein n=1 Tax=Streptomyces cinnamoneus TaxID=53446 RepID=A0A2G1XJL1_STRCJ|nr:hypothetical protein BLA24_13960 [Streptomyces cinnamoneus]
MESRLTPQEVESRLRRVLGTATPVPAPDRPAEPVMPSFGSQAQWAAYGYHVVRRWLSAVATGRHRAHLSADEIDELAVETTARALNSFRDQARQPIAEPRAAAPELKTAFLTECVRHLPYAHRNRLHTAEHVPFVEFENTDEADLVGMLWGRATTDQAEALRHVACGQDEDVDTDEVVALTPLAIRAAALRYPEAVDPASIG